MKYLKYLIIILFAVFIASCSASRKNPWAQKKKQSHISATQLGRNKYFFSNEYQKKLKRSYKKHRY